MLCMCKTLLFMGFNGVRRAPWATPVALVMSVLVRGEAGRGERFSAIRSKTRPGLRTSADISLAGSYFDGLFASYLGGHQALSSYSCGLYGGKDRIYADINLKCVERRHLEVTVSVEDMQEGQNVNGSGGTAKFAGSR